MFGLNIKGYAIDDVNKCKGGEIKYMFSIKNNSVRRYDRSVPYVQFESERIELELSELFNIEKDFYYYLGLVLLRLGFEPEDKIMISNYEKKDNSFDCTVNNHGSYHIRVDNIKSNNMEIVVNRFDTEFGYTCERCSVSEVGMKISLGRYTIRYPEGIIFTRFLSREGAKFIVQLDDNILELEVEKPVDLNLPLYDERGCYAKYKFDNEEELVDYLVGLNIEASITDIYKKIIGIYITDVDKYPKFSLSRTRIMEDGQLKVTDLISLRDGNLDRFGITELGTTIFVDKDDNWLYEMSSESALPVDFYMSLQNGKLSCMFSCDKEYNVKAYTRQVICSDITDAYDEVLEVKKRVKKLFNNTKGSK